MKDKNEKQNIKIPTIALVTGANGFVGANLVHALLSRGYTVHAIVRPDSNVWRLENVIEQITLHKSEITDAEKIQKIIQKILPNYVFHTVHYGGNSGQTDTEKVRKVIIEGTAILYDACLKVKTIKSIVNTGSSSEYGSKEEPMEENMSLEPNTEYAVAKVWATYYGRHLAREKNLPIITARLFNVYGLYEHRNRFMTEVILACLKGEQPVLTNPKTKRDFIFVCDVVDALINISNNGKPGEIYNVGTGKESSLEEAVKLIIKYTGYKNVLKWGTMDDRKFDTIHWRADISHTKNILGWEAKYDLEEGIKETVSWFRENLSLYDNLKK